MLQKNVIARQKGTGASQEMSQKLVKRQCVTAYLQGVAAAIRVLFLSPVRVPSMSSVRVLNGDSNPWQCFGDVQEKLHPAFPASLRKMVQATGLLAEQKKNPRRRSGRWNLETRNSGTPLPPRILWLLYQGGDVFLLGSEKKSSSALSKASSPKREVGGPPSVEELRRL